MKYINCPTHSLQKYLTHWGWVTHICVANLTIIASDNGLSPGRRQAIIWTNAGILLLRPLGTKLQWNVNRNSNIFIHENAFENIFCDMASIWSRPQWVKSKSSSYIWAKFNHRLFLWYVWYKCRTENRNIKKRKIITYSCRISLNTTDIERLPKPHFYCMDKIICNTLSHHGKCQCQY